MPDHDAAELARLLHERGEDVRGASGTTEYCEAFAEAWSSVAGGTARVLVATRAAPLAISRIRSLPTRSVHHHPKC